MNTDDSRFASWTPASVDSLTGTGIRRHDGVAVFADLSGFTALTERLRRTRGQRGVEALTDRINGIFGAMIMAVRAAGGQVLKFGGDALLISFEGEAVLDRATHCSGHLHRVVCRYSRIARGGRLALHIGMAQGHWMECVTGFPGTRREHFVFGPAVTEALRQADAAKNGQTRLWMRGSARRMLDRISPRRVAPNSWLISRQPHRDDPRSGPGATPSLSRDPSGCIDFVPAQLRDLLRDESLEPLRAGEHRRVATIFVFWRGFGAASGQVGESIWDDVFEAVHETTRRFDGLWARCDPGQGYQKILILFGAPVAARDDVERSIGCAVALRERLTMLVSRHARLRFGIGMSTQTVFTGFVGSVDRMEFTAMGEGVNLAARLAAHARHRQILVDDDTRRTAEWWDFALGPRLSLKGVAGTVQTACPTNQRSAGDRPGGDDIVEYPAAMAEARRRWEESPAESLPIVADPEADSRRFVAQLISRLDIPPQPVRHVIFIDRDGMQPHGGLARFLQLFFEGMSPTEIRDAHTGSIEPEIQRVCGAILGDDRILGQLLTKHGSVAYEGLAVRAVRDLIGPRSARAEGLVFVLERLDKLSNLDQRVFQALLSRSIGPIRVVSTSHNREAGDPRAISLGSITKMEMRAVLGQLLPPEAISARLLDFIQRKSRGLARLASLYIESLRREGHLTPPGGTRAGWHLADLSLVELPDSLRAHFVQQLDRIPRDCSRVARALAVLGDAVPRAALNSLCRQEMVPGEIERACQGLESLGLIAIEDTANGSLIRALDSNFRQASYETMSFAEREHLHLRATRYWRGIGVSGIEEAGRHAFLGREFNFARPLLTRAARRAHRLWMFEKAQELYRWALLSVQRGAPETGGRLLPALPQNLSPLHIELLRPLAAILRERGLYPEAARIHQRLATHHESQRAVTDALREHLSAARLDWLAGRYKPAERRASAVLRRARRQHTPDLVAEASLVLGEVMRRTGRLPEAEAHLAEAVARLQTHRHSALIADALNSRGIVAWNQGHLLEASRHFRAALAHLRRRKDLPRRGQIANNLGILFEEAGQLPRAGRYYQRAFAIFDSAGQRRNRAYCLGNLANLHRHGARFEAARSAYEEAEFELQSIGEQHAVAYTWGNLGDLYRDFGQWEHAHELYSRTLAFARRVADHELTSESKSRLAEVALSGGGWHRAAALISQARRSARVAQSKEFGLRAEILDAVRRLERGEAKRAWDLLNARAGTAGHSGLLYYSLWVDAARAQTARTLGEMASARRLAHSGMRRARRSGYRWWEFQFAVLRAQMESGSPGSQTMTASCDRALQQAEEIHDQILSAIGDPDIRASFTRTSVVRALQTCRESHARSLVPSPTH